MNWRQRSTQLIDNLTRRFHLDVRFYGRSGGLMAASYTSSVLRGVATTFLMARWLPDHTLGEFRYVLALFGVAGIFALTGMNSGIIRGISKGDTIVVREALKKILLFAPLGSLVLVAAGMERMMHAEQIVAFGFFVAAGLFPLYSICGLYGPILTGKQDIKRLTLYAIVNNVLFSACFVLILRGHQTLLAVILAYFMFDIFFRGLLTVYEYRRLPKHGNAQEHLALGGHLSGIGIFQTIAAQLDSILIQRFAGYGSLAHYSIATIIPEQIKDMVNSMSGIILQRFSRYEANKKILKQTQRHFWVGMAGTALVIASYAALAPFIIPWLFPQYASDVLPSIIYAIGLFGMPSMIGLNFLQAHNQIRSLWTFYVSNAVIQVASNLALIPFFGNWGAILSKTGTRLAGTALSYPRLTEKKDS